MLATSRVHRKPLQQKNQNTPTTTNSAQPKPEPCIVIEEVSLLSCNKDKDKENVHPFFFYSTNPPPPPPANSDRADEMRSEKMLRERGVMLDLEMEEMVKRGEVQKQLELEVDRLYRLKEIKLACMVSTTPLLLFFIPFHFIS